MDENLGQLPGQLPENKHTKWLPLTLAIVAIGVVTIFAYFYLGQNNTENVQTALTENIATTTIATLDTSNWKTYQKEEYGFGFNYPNSVIIYEEGNVINLDNNNGLLITIFARPIDEEVFPEAEYSQETMMVDGHNFSLGTYTTKGKLNLIRGVFNPSLSNLPNFMVDIRLNSNPEANLVTTKQILSTFKFIDISEEALLDATSRQIYDIDISPSSVTTDITTTITATANLAPSSKLIKDKVVIKRYTSKGVFISELGRLYDDGTHGDRVAGDNSFTNQFTFKDSTLGQTFFRASATYKSSSSSIEVLSDIFPFNVFAKSLSPGEVLILIADALDKGDVNTAINYIGKDKNKTWVKELSPEDQKGLAGILRAATLDSNNGNYARYTVDGSEVNLDRDYSGKWLLMDW